MNIEILNKLDSNPLYRKYLRNNSFWYKTLNRNPKKIEELIKQMKKDYKLRAIDKFDNVVDSVDLISKFLKVASE